MNYGIDIALDTRRDANLPGDAVYFGVGWERLAFEESVGGKVDSFSLDARAYKLLVGQALLAGRIYLGVADAPLPDYQRPFLGGAATLRGYKPGAFVGDNIALASLELRLPLTGVLDRYRAGFHLFIDSGAVYDDGQDLGDADFHYGVGIGGFAFAAVFGITADIAYDLEGDVRLHLSSGFRF